MNKTQKRRLQRKRAKLSKRWESFIKSDSFILIDYVNPECNEKHVIDDKSLEKLNDEFALEVFGPSSNSSSEGFSTVCFTLDYIEYIETRLDKLVWARKIYEQVKFSNEPHKTLVEVYTNKFFSWNWAIEPIYLLEFTGDYEIWNKK